MTYDSNYKITKITNTNNVQGANNAVIFETNIIYGNDSITVYDDTNKDKVVITYDNYIPHRMEQNKTLYQKLRRLIRTLQ